MKTVEIDFTTRKDGCSDGKLSMAKWQSLI